MQTIDKHIAFLTKLASTSTILSRCQRFTVEQKVAPFYRTFVALGITMERDELNKLEDLAAEHGLNCNPFRAGSVVSTVTFTDMEETRSHQG